MASLAKRRFAVISGKRGGFGAMLPLMQLIDRSEDTELILIVTDQHLYEEFGMTVNEVERWLRVSHKLFLGQGDDHAVSRAVAIGSCVRQMATTLEADRPDMLVVLGDRGEVLAGVIAAINLRIPVAHIQGGDLSGSLDEFVRHAITKMSHLHFPSTKLSAERIRRMGEEEWRIHAVGDCHLDLIHRGCFTPAEGIYRKYKLDPDHPIILVLQHPVATEPDKAYDQMRAICDALRYYRYKSILVYPCTDQGYQGTIRAIEEMRGESYVQVHKNIECHDFWGLQNVASVFVGNSSAGLIETPSFRLPSVTVGNRQEGREHAENCLHADHNTEAIIAAIDHCLNDKEFLEQVANCSLPFGDGFASDKIFNVLTNVDLSPSLFEKKMTY
jgi:GDP/UDP-N,N'-diacetylbacillosamine 2-epimerase (hydrolysing)